MWVTKLLIFPVEIRIFCPKTTKFGPKLAFLVNLGQAMQASSVPCQWVGWWLWRAGCISQDTFLLYCICPCLQDLDSPKKCPWFHSVHRIGDPVDAAVKNNSEICRNTKQIQRRLGQQHPSRQDNVLLSAWMLSQGKIIERATSEGVSMRSQRSQSKEKEGQI